MPHPVPSYPLLSILRLFVSHDLEKLTSFFAFQQRYGRRFVGTSVAPLLASFLLLMCLVSTSQAQYLVKLNVNASSTNLWNGDCTLCQDEPCDIGADVVTALSATPNDDCSLLIYGQNKSLDGITLNAMSVHRGLNVYLDSSLILNQTIFHLGSPLNVSAYPTRSGRAPVQLTGSSSIYYFLDYPTSEFYSRPSVSFSNGLELSIDAKLAGVQILKKRQSFLSDETVGEDTRSLGEKEQISSELSSALPYTSSDKSLKRSNLDLPSMPTDNWYYVTDCTIFGEHKFGFIIDDAFSTPIDVASTSVYLNNVTIQTNNQDYFVEANTKAPLLLDMSGHTLGSINVLSSLIHAPLAFSASIALRDRSSLSVTSSSISSSDFVGISLANHSKLVATETSTPISESIVSNATVDLSLQSTLIGLDLTNATISLSDSNLINVRYMASPTNVTHCIKVTGSTSIISYDDSQLPAMHAGENVYFFYPFLLTNTSISIAPLATLVFNTTVEFSLGIHGLVMVEQSAAALNAQDLCTLVLHDHVDMAAALLNTSCNLKLAGEKQIVTSMSLFPSYISGLPAALSDATSAFPYISFHPGSSAYQTAIDFNQFSVAIVDLPSETWLSDYYESPTVRFYFTTANLGMPRDGFALVVPSDFNPTPADWVLFALRPLENASLYGNYSAASAFEPVSISFQIELIYGSIPDVKKRGDPEVTRATMETPYTFVYARLAPSSPAPVATPVRPPTSGTANGCSATPPSAGFTCIDGTWHSNGPVTSATPIIIQSSTIVEGNFSAPSITFSTIGSSLIIQGCLNLTQGTITADLSQGIGSHPSGSITIEQNSECPNSLLGIGVNVKQPKTGCKKVKSKIDSASTKQTLVVLFTTDSSSCNTKWIILGAVLGSAIIIAAIATLIVGLVLKNKAQQKDFRAIRKDVQM